MTPTTSFNSISHISNSRTSTSFMQESKGSTTDRTSPTSGADTAASSATSSVAPRTGDKATSKKLQAQLARKEFFQELAQILIEMKTGLLSSPVVHHVDKPCDPNASILNDGTFVPSPLFQAAQTKPEDHLMQPPVQMEGCDAKNQQKNYNKKLRSFNEKANSPEAAKRIGEINKLVKGVEARLLACPMRFHKMERHTYIPQDTDAKPYQERLNNRKSIYDEVIGAVSNDLEAAFQSMKNMPSTPESRACLDGLQTAMRKLLGAKETAWTDTLHSSNNFVDKAKQMERALAKMRKNRDLSDPNERAKIVGTAVRFKKELWAMIGEGRARYCEYLRIVYERNFGIKISPDDSEKRKAINKRNMTELLPLIPEYRFANYAVVKPTDTDSTNDDSSLVHQVEDGLINAEEITKMTQRLRQAPPEGLPWNEYFIMEMNHVDDAVDTCMSAVDMLYAVVNYLESDKNPYPGLSSKQMAYVSSRENILGIAEKLRALSMENQDLEIALVNKFHETLPGTQDKDCHNALTQLRSELQYRKFFTSIQADMLEKYAELYAKPAAETTSEAANDAEEPQTATLLSDDEDESDDNNDISAASDVEDSVPDQAEIEEKEAISDTLPGKDSPPPAAREKSRRVNSHATLIAFSNKNTEPNERQQLSEQVLALEKQAKGKTALAKHFSSQYQIAPSANGASEYLMQIVDNGKKARSLYRNMVSLLRKGTNVTGVIAYGKTREQLASGYQNEANAAGQNMRLHQVYFQSLKSHTPTFDVLLQLEARHEMSMALAPKFFLEFSKKHYRIVDLKVNYTPVTLDDVPDAKLDLPPARVHVHVKSHIDGSLQSLANIQADDIEFGHAKSPQQHRLGEEYAKKHNVEIFHQPIPDKEWLAQKIRAAAQERLQAG